MTTETKPEAPFSIDALLPQAIAQKAEDVGARKARLDATSLFTLALLAGAFIAFGSMFATTVLAGAAGAVPFGLARLAAGFVFSLGLILVVLGGAELFTGDTLMIMAAASRKITLRELMRTWAIVLAGNFAGAIGAAVLAFLAGQYLAGDGAVGKVALKLALDKSTLPPMRAFFLGVLCNVLVCLAVWLSMGARTSMDKIAAIVFPVSAFVAAGFEHSVANMYFIPLGLLIRDFAPVEFWSALGASPQDYAALGWGVFLNSLVPVTLGNIVGGAALVGGVYWFVYLRRRAG